MGRRVTFWIAALLAVGLISTLLLLWYSRPPKFPGLIGSTRNAVDEFFVSYLPFEEISIAPDGTVLLQSWDELRGYSPDLDNHWTCSIRRSITAHSIDISPSGRIYVASFDEGIVAVSPKGQKLWSAGPSGWTMRSVVRAPADGVYAVDHENRICRLSSEGDLLWEFDGGWHDDLKCGTGSEYYSLAVLKDGTALVDTRTGYPGPEGPSLYAVDRDGKLIYKSFTLRLASTGYVDSQALLLTSSLGVQTFESEKDGEPPRIGDALVPDLWVDTCMNISSVEEGHSIIQPFARWTADNVERHNKLTLLGSDGTKSWELDGPPEFYSPAFELPDMRFVAVAWGGKSMYYLAIINADGSLAKTISLPGGPATYPAVAEGGMVYVATPKWLMAIDPTQV